MARIGIEGDPNPFGDFQSTLYIHLIGHSESDAENGQDQQTDLCNQFPMRGQDRDQRALLIWLKGMKNPITTHNEQHGHQRQKNAENKQETQIVAHRRAPSSRLYRLYYHCFIVREKI